MTAPASAFTALGSPRGFLAIVAGLLLLLYGPLIIYWYNGWLNHNISIEHEYFSHGVIGLPLAATLVWQRRDRWAALKDTWHPLGGVCLGLAAVFYLSGLTDTVNLSLPLMLAGLCLWFKGLPGLRLQRFPLLLLLLATPTDAPYLVEPYTLGLQSFIASGAAFILLQFHFDVTVQDIYLYVGGRVVEVAPHCAGLKALFSNLYFCLMGMYWMGMWKPWSKALTLIAGAIGISVIVNIFRNAILTFFHGTGQDGLFDWFHEGWGSQLYWVCLIGLLVLLFKGVELAWPESSATPIAALEDPEIHSLEGSTPDPNSVELGEEGQEQTDEDHTDEEHYDRPFL